jgi:hypothetical protein
MTFLDACLRGQCSPSDIYDWVERWEHEATISTPLADYLGLTADEYAAWVEGHLTMAAILESRAGEDTRGKARCP